MSPLSIANSLNVSWILPVQFRGGHGESPQNMSSKAAWSRVPFDELLGPRNVDVPDDVRHRRDIGTAWAERDLKNHLLTARKVVPGNL